MLSAIVIGGIGKLHLELHCTVVEKGKSAYIKNIYDIHNTANPVLSSHSKIDQTKILMANGSLMKVESIALLEHSAILLTCIKR